MGIHTDKDLAISLLTALNRFVHDKNLETLIDCSVLRGKDLNIGAF